MVIIHLSGGFGNQLYSYAFGYAMAKERQDDLAIDTAIQDAPWFFRNPDIMETNITYDQRITYKITRKISDRAVFNKIRFRKAIGLFTKEIREDMEQRKFSLQVYYEKAKKYKNVYFRGNWGSCKFFEPYEDEIKKRFTFRTPLSFEAQKIAEQIRQEPQAVTIHYRTGDYVKLGACMHPDYYKKAMEYMAGCIENPVFFCFSEDLSWVKKQFKDLPYDIRYPEYDSEKKGIEDFRLLSEGNHQIISNSSYSWWAAYLNEHEEKIVVTPQGGICDEEFCLEEWIKIPFDTISEQKYMEMQ